ncbi:hypothetical protein DD238_001237 [Peronospora effusa]|uniref:Uncharacterized protein n=1 Tax=Peronospora effusa TaxID=542832 RepID=A0A3M6VJ79_9STRA|nr:hypothetical protein DD238_001237 [Peronospora effusa]
MGIQQKTLATRTTDRFPTLSFCPAKPLYLSMSWLEKERPAVVREIKRSDEAVQSIYMVAIELFIQVT